MGTQFNGPAIGGVSVESLNNGMLCEPTWISEPLSCYQERSWRAVDE